MPRCEAISITPAAAVSAAKPCTGRRVVTLIPRVLITRQPPTAVPELIARAEGASHRNIDYVRLAVRLFADFMGRIQDVRPLLEISSPYL